MSYMSDRDIRKALGRDIVIEPFSETSLTPIGYDFSVGEYVYSLEEGLLEAEDGVYSLPPKNTIQILTKESLWVSSRVAGTFHSKVSLVSRGFSHISTTLDPGWYGPLLITIRNNTDKQQEIKTDDTFVTLLFSRVTSPTASKHFKPEFRKDILINQLENQTQAYLKKIKQVLGDPRALESFENQVNLANRPMISKILSSAWKKGAIELIFSGGRILTFLAMGIILTIGLYWDIINPLFGGIAYDSKIIGTQIAVFFSLFAVAMATKRK